MRIKTRFKEKKKKKMPTMKKIMKTKRKERVAICSTLSKNPQLRQVLFASKPSTYMHM
jgi:hypothetical protein